MSIENQSLWDFFLTIRKTEKVGTLVQFLQKICDTEKNEELEMDTDSFYLALSEENLEDVIIPKKRAEWDQLRSKDCTYDFTANGTDNFFPKTCCNVHKKHDTREPDLFKEEFWVCRNVASLCLCSKTYCCYDKQTDNHKFSSRGLNKQTFEECGDGGPMSKYRKVLKEALNVTSTNFERFSIVLLRKNKQRRDCLTFIQKE